MPGGNDEQGDSERVLLSVSEEFSTREPVASQREEPTTVESLRSLLSSKLNVLLVFCIFGPAAGIAGWEDTYAFTV